MRRRCRKLIGLAFLKTLLHQSYKQHLQERGWDVDQEQQRTIEVTCNTAETVPVTEGVCWSHAKWYLSDQCLKIWKDSRISPGFSGWLYGIWWNKYFDKHHETLLIKNYFDLKFSPSKWSTAVAVCCYQFSTFRISSCSHFWHLLLDQPSDFFMSSED